MNFIRIVYCLFCSLLFSVIGRGQDSGIKFETGLSWKEVQAKASRENKLIFVDCYATWCGPCKTMDQEIYPRKDVGEYFNAHFINVKVQMDRTPKDLQVVREWYSDADNISQKYQIAAFPTYLFFTAEGQAVHQIVGISESGAEFINKAATAMDPQRQYFALLYGFYVLLYDLGNHKTDSVHLLRTLLAAKEAGDNERARIIANQYIVCLKNPITKFNIDLLDPLIAKESDKGFDLYVHNAAIIDLVYGRAGFAEETLTAVFFNQEIAPLFLNAEGSIYWKKISTDFLTKYSYLSQDLLATKLEKLFNAAIGREINRTIESKEFRSSDWAQISLKLKKRFPGYDCGQILLGKEARYYFTIKSWEKCANATISLIDRYGTQLKAASINDMIWRCVFLHANNKRLIIKAVKDMELVVKLAPNDVADLDTYANLLYKAGYKGRAIDWENKAISVAEGNNQDSSELKETAKKMRSGEITWGDAAERS